MHIPHLQGEMLLAHTLGHYHHPGNEAPNKYEDIQC